MSSWSLFIRSTKRRSSFQESPPARLPPQGVPYPTCCGCGRVSLRICRRILLCPCRRTGRTPHGRTLCRIPYLGGRRICPPSYLNSMGDESNSETPCSRKTRMNSMILSSRKDDLFPLTKHTGSPVFLLSFSLSSIRVCASFFGRQHLTNTTSEYAREKRNTFLKMDGRFGFLLFQRLPQELDHPPMTTSVCLSSYLSLPPYPRSSYLRMHSQSRPHRVSLPRFFLSVLFVFPLLSSAANRLNQPAFPL